LGASTVLFGLLLTGLVVMNWALSEASDPVVVSCIAAVVLPISLAGLTSLIYGLRGVPVRNGIKLTAYEIGALSQVGLYSRFRWVAWN
jgi:hypothetical protein